MTDQTADQSRQPVTIKGDLVSLRPVEVEDLERTRVWRNDPDIRDAQLGYPFPVTDEMEEKWFSDVRSGDRPDLLSLAIVQTENDSLVGLIHLRPIDWVARSARMGITIGDTKMQGKGFGAEATRLIIIHAFTTLNLHRVWLEVVANNERAIKLYERLGFQNEGRLRQHAYVGGIYRDVLVMGLMREEFNE